MQEAMSSLKFFTIKEYLLTQAGTCFGYLNSEQYHGRVLGQYQIRLSGLFLGLSLGLGQNPRIVSF